MNNYEKFRDIAEAFREIARKHNIAIVTATQPRRESNSFERVRMPRPEHDIIIVDHINLIRPDIYGNEEPKDI